MRAKLSYKYCSSTLLIFIGILLLFASSLWGQEAGGEKYIFDSHGKKISFTKPFTRIISLYSAHTENLCTLGAANQLSGISTSDDYPDIVLDRPRFSYRDDPEKFIAGSPDLVLIRPMVERSYPEFIKKLRDAGITVISLQPTNIEEMLDYWRALGSLSGHEEEAETMCKRFSDSVSAMTARVDKIPESERPKVYFEAIHAKMKTFAENSIGMFILETAGGVNIVSDASRVRTTNIAFVGKEKLLSRGNDIDIFLSQHGRMNPVNIEVIKNEPGFEAIRAVRDNNIYLIDEQLVSRPTIRILEGIDKLHTIFYPLAEVKAEAQQ
ncbi:ABC transporter substrate-binding protein [Desulforhopalus sp. IMCC35007]|uniref:ABC transporter substrate-binding protein n=1 Tax=Desulforhopalus sp. IMCC35007 TaxID=2569543 RepID=UPI0010AE9130|nr:ABC transporter substrate-binding protein [Desulforhopalus sp. IMCC35007]TKB07176.1 ABC transporter substrate-binding protein [Desulforhopalus sp. IMCC35007]